jgi:hypothetical protein
MKEKKSYFRILVTFSGLRGHFNSLFKNQWREEWIQNKFGVTVKEEKVVL